MNQLRQRRQVVLNYFDDMGVEISEASQDGPYLFKPLLYGENLQKKTRTLDTYGHSSGFSELMPFTNTSSGNRIGWYIGRVDNWTGTWDTIAKAIDSSKNIVLYNATVGNKEDIAGKITKNPHIIITGCNRTRKIFPRSDYLFKCSFQNVKTLYIDPKRELRKSLPRSDNSPEFAPYPERKSRLRTLTL